MWTLRLRREIEEDLRDGQDWYNSMAEGLGEAFIDQFWNAIVRILDNPLLYGVSRNGLHTCRLKQFSYIVYYRIIHEEVLIVAVWSGYHGESSLAGRD